MRSGGGIALSPRQKDGRRGNLRSFDDEYVVFIQGIPPQCRWQELKDFVRQTALHIRQAVVYDDSRGHPTGLGQIIVKNEDEAWRTYNRLSTRGWNGHSLTVTLSLANEPTKPIAGPTKSPSLNNMGFVSGFTTPPNVGNTDIPMSPTFPTMPEHHQQQQTAFMGHVNGLYPPQYVVQFAPESMGYTLPVVFPNDTGYFMTGSPYYPSSFDNCKYGMPHYGNNHDNNLATAVHQPPYAGYMYPHRHSVSGPTINHQYSPTIPNPGTHIFVYNLRHDTTSQQVKDHFGKAGHTERCEIFERQIGGNSRTCASIAFRDKEESRRAIAMFDNSIFGGARIRVRFDRERGASTGNIHHHYYNPTRPVDATARDARNNNRSEFPVQNIVNHANPKRSSSANDMASENKMAQQIPPGVTPSASSEKRPSPSLSPTGVPGPTTTTQLEAEVHPQPGPDSPGLGNPNGAGPLVVNGSCVGSRSTALPAVVGLEKGA